MNRRAIALAADSAATVTTWARGEAKKRYFKGSNKIFQLSLTGPVGLMINGSGSLQGVPWETLTKTYRDSYLERDFDNLADYPAHFLQWVEGNHHAFPIDFLREQFLAEVIEGAGRLVFSALRDVPATTKKSDRPAQLKQKFDKRAKAVEGAPMLANAVQADIDSALADHLDEATGRIENAGYAAPLAMIIGSRDVAKAAIVSVYKKGHTTLDSTGLVFGGYGSIQFFPSVETYRCYGIVLGKLIFSREESDCRIVNQYNVAEIIPFAKSDMIYTFIAGTSIAGLIAIDELAKL